MSEYPETAPPDWDLGDWERVLTITVGSEYVCRICQNLVMVTRGGVGNLELICCGQQMEEVTLPDAAAEEDEE